MIKRTELESRYDLTFSVTGIATGRHGAAVDPSGLDVQRALDLVEGREEGPGMLDSISTRPVLGAGDFIQNCRAEVLFENTPVNYQTGQPAIDHLRAALEAGMHAITANKGPVVHAYRSLTALAESKGLKFLFESTVMDGAPIFSLFRGSLPAAQLLAIRGVLNSTTNLILTRMERGETMEEAIAYAQSIGITETDPSGDVEGWDAAVKIAALVTVLMGIPLKPEQVDRRGIRDITPGDIARAREEGKRWKLVCYAKRHEEGVEARVAPELAPSSSPLYNVEGTTSIVQFETDVLGLLSVVESDPGPETTAYGLLADFINAVRA